MKNFAIYGSIVDTDEQRETFEDVTPAQFRAFINKLEDGEELEVAINSPGGSCFGGIAIANMIKQLNASGHKTTAVVQGVAASIASVIMCACEKIVMNESSLVMIHNCWSIVQGDSNALRKEAESMDVINDAIVSFYKSKFDLPTETIRQYMEEELWFSGIEVEAFAFNCEVIPDEKDFSIAAKIKDFDLKKFKHTPKALKEMKMEEQTQENIEQTETALEEVKDQTASVENADVNDETLAIENVAVENETMIPLAEAEKRVAGMQSTMAKKLDALKKEYDAKIEEFQVQMKAKDEELAKAKADATSFKESLEKSAEELSNVTSALEEKKNALETLNALVNTPAEDDVPTFSEGVKACKSPKEVLDFIKSGKYKKH